MGRLSAQLSRKAETKLWLYESLLGGAGSEYPMRPRSQPRLSRIDATSERMNVTSVRSEPMSDFSASTSRSILASSRLMSFRNQRKTAIVVPTVMKNCRFWSNSLPHAGFRQSDPTMFGFNNFVNFGPGPGVSIEVDAVSHLPKEKSLRRRAVSTRPSVSLCLCGESTCVKLGSQKISTKIDTPRVLE